MFVIGFAAALVLLDRVYLPRPGITLGDLHQTGEQVEGILSGFIASAVHVLEARMAASGRR